MGDSILLVVLIVRCFGDCLDIFCDLAVKGLAKKKNLNQFPISGLERSRCAADASRTCKSALVNPCRILVLF